MTEWTTWGRTSVDPANRRVFVDGRRLAVTAACYTALAALVQLQGGVLGRERLSRLALGRRLSGGNDRSADQIIHNLRRVMPRDADGNHLIEGVRGAGYCLHRGHPAEDCIMADDTPLPTHPMIGPDTFLARIPGPASRFGLEDRPLTPGQQSLLQAIRAKAAELEALFNLVNAGRCRALGLTALEEAVMWAEKEMVS